MSNDTIEPDAAASDIDESRRRLFGKGAAVAAVAAVAGLASSSKANAANGDTMLVGATNSATTVTTLIQGGSTFRVNDGTTSGAASIYGVQGSSAGTSGVRGDATMTGGRGVYGLAGGSSGIGVYGQFNTGGTESGTGVLGQSSNGTGVIGRGTSFDLYAGTSGRVGMAAATVSATASGSIGTIARDADGVLWYCYAANKWQRIGGAALAGGFTPINPVRVFDSRNSGFPTPGVFAAGSSRVVNVKDGRDQTTGALTVPDAVPTGATAVTFNVTATNTSGGNFLAVAPGDAVSTDVSTLNWSTSGVSIANASVVKLDGSRQLKIFAGPGGSFDAIVDVTGYYL